MTPLIREWMLRVAEIGQSSNAGKVLMRLLLLLLLLLLMVMVLWRGDMSEMRTGGTLAKRVVIRERHHSVGYLIRHERERTTRNELPLVYSVLPLGNVYYLLKQPFK